MSQTRPFRIAVLISGGGTTLRNFLEKIAAGTLPVEIGLVVSSCSTAKGLRFAADAGIPSAVVERKAFCDQDAFSRAIFDRCREARVDLVVMAGFLKRVTIPEEFANRVVNIHPGLIPAFCGQGFYGHRVHEAVLEYGAKLSGCTVHFADNQYDHGPVILQRAVPVLDDDTPETLAARVFEAECEAYPEALRLLAAGRVSLEGRRVRIEGAVDSVRNFVLAGMLLLATAIWGWTFVVVKDAVAGYGVVAFLALRFAIGSAVLAGFAARQFNKRSLLVGGGIGIVLALGYYFQTLGLRYTSVTNSGFITSLFVVTTPIINRLLFGVKIRPTFWAAVAISLAGLYLLTSTAPPDGSRNIQSADTACGAGISPAPGSADVPSAQAAETAALQDAGGTPAPRHDAGGTPALRHDAGETPALPASLWDAATSRTGDLLTLAAAILYGLHIALLDRHAKNHPPFTLAFGQTLSTATLFLLVWPLSNDPLQWPTAHVWVALAITGVLATALAFAIQTYVQQRLSAIASTLILTAEPVFAATFGWLLLGERLGGVQSLGIALMIGAILVAQIGAGEHASKYPLDPL